MKLAYRVPRSPQKFWPTTPEPVPTQAEQRERRRHRLRIEYTETFDLTAEIRAIIEPLAVGVAADPVPGAYRENVDELAAAVMRCVDELTALTGGAGDRRRVEHLGTVEDRERALTLLRAHRRDHGRPTIDDESLVEGTWHIGLVERAGGVTSDLSAYLGRRHEPFRDGRTPSSVVETALREVDRAALSLSRRIARRAADRELFATKPAPAIDSVARELESLGVSL